MGVLSVLLGIIVVFLFPLGQIARIDVGSGIAINLLDGGILVMAILSIILATFKRKMPFWVVPLVIFGMLGLLGLIINRTLVNNELVVSLLYLFRFVAYASVALGVNLLSEKQKNRVWKALFIGGGLLLLAGYLQYFLYPSLRNLLYAGWDPHLYRMFGTFLDPNFAGPFFVFYFLLVLDAFFQNRGRKKIVLGIFGLLGILGVLLTFSRGAYIDLGIGFLVYIFLKGYKKIAITLPIGIILLGFVFAYFVPTGEGKNLLRTASTDARLKSAQNALIIFAKNPILGVGFDSYRYASHRYNLLNAFNWEDTHSGAGANNSFVFVLATTGILGGIVYGWFWFVILRHSIQDIKKKKTHAIFFFSSWITLFVSGIFENTLFYPSIMLWMFVLLGLALTPTLSQKARETNET